MEVYNGVCNSGLFGDIHLLQEIGKVGQIGIMVEGPSEQLKFSALEIKQGVEKLLLYGSEVINNNTSFEGNASVDHGYDHDQPSPMSSMLGSKLNPNAKEWSPETEGAAEQDKCLFLTFSNGYPLDERQITLFFTQKYGACVDKVYVHWPRATRRSNKRRCRMPPLFGKVVFKASYFPAIILCGQNEVKFSVDRKTLWCKRFQPHKNFLPKN